MNRIEVLRSTFEKLPADAFFISDFYNILYYTGFKTLSPNEREAFVLATKKNVYLFTDSRYVDDHLHQLVKENNFQFCLLEVGKGLVFHLDKIIHEEDLKTIAFESENLKYAEYDRLKTILKEITFVPTELIGMNQRSLKDETEIESIAKACELSDECLSEVMKDIKEGMTEKQIGFNLEMWTRSHGYDIAFDPIVAFNANAAVAHYNTKEGNGILTAGSSILVDYGIKYKDYCSDITRMFYFKSASDELRKAHETLLKAQQTALQGATTSSTADVIDKACRDSITKNNYPNFMHSLGHGVGLEVHEFPKVSQFAKETFCEGQVFTIEPGIYIEGKFGMRIEDTVVMRNGKAEVLTKMSKEIVIV